MKFLEIAAATTQLRKIANSAVRLDHLT